MTEDEKNEIIARVLQAVGAVNIPASPYPLPAPAREHGGSFLNFVGTIVLLAVCIVGALALLANKYPGFAGKAETYFSTPAALPTANVVPNAPAARTAPYTTIIEATFPPPIPEQEGVVVPPTPWPADVGATAQAATNAAGVLTATAEGQSVIDRWLSGPPSTATPTVWADFVETFSTPEPCSPLVGYIAGPCKPTPEE